MVLLKLDASPIKDHVGSVVLDLQGNVVQGNVVTASSSTDDPAIDSTATKLPVLCVPDIFGSWFVTVTVISTYGTLFVIVVDER